MRPRPKILTKGVVAEPSHGTLQFVAPHHLPHMIRLHRRDRVRDWRQSEIDVAALGRAKQLLFARDTARATEPARPRSPTWPTELPATIGASRLLRAARGVHTPPWRVQPRSGTPTPCYSHGNTPAYSQYGVPHGPGTLFDKARPTGPGSPRTPAIRGPVQPPCRRDSSSTEYTHFYELSPPRRRASRIALHSSRSRDSGCFPRKRPLNIVGNHAR